MAEPDQPSAGMFGSLRRLLDTGMVILHNRLELFAVELKEEKCRFIEILIFASAAILFGVMAVTMVTFTVVFLFWESARAFVLIAFSLFYVGGAVWTYLSLKKRLSSRSMPFAESISEIKKDQQWLQSRS